jgi:Winged helix-turn helix
MRLHEEFGLSVSDDTIYRVLKGLGFSHVSVRPKAYKQGAEALEAFKKTSSYAWRKSAGFRSRRGPSMIRPSSPLTMLLSRHCSISLLRIC